MRLSFLLLFLVTVTWLGAADQAAQKKPAPETPSADDLYNTGKALFDEYAPPEIKEEYEFPSRESFDDFAKRLQQALDGNDLSELVKYEPEARAALTALRALPGYEDYADWLSERLDYIEAAKQASRQPPPLPSPTPTTPTVPTARPTPAPSALNIPYYDLWVQRVRARPVPSRADELMPILRAAFAAEGVPPEIAWLAEAESTMDPSARSPVGAKGLFQLMPATAKSLGLSTMLPDERADAEKSAHAAAKYLRTLHGKFGDWPLAFAAYNSGEGRVRRLLAAQSARDFAGISSHLSVETRMYVPKVCATIAVRTGVTPDKLAGPQ